MALPNFYARFHSTLIVACRKTWLAANTKRDYTAYFLIEYLPVNDRRQSAAERSTDRTVALVDDGSKPVAIFATIWRG